MIRTMVVAVLLVLVLVPVSYSEEKIDLNNATDKELKRLPGVGNEIARRIIEYRELKGGFKSVEELKNIKGIGEKRFNSIKDLIVIKAEPDEINMQKSTESKK